VLVKLPNRAYVDDFGLLVEGENPYVYMYENGIVRLSASVKPIPVVKIKARWVHKNVKISCEIADTEEKKILGLQKHASLPEGTGMYFPYAGPTNVTFHQGSVPFSLDLMFLREGEVVKIEANTVVGGSDRWGCSECDGVIEAAAGFCADKEVGVSDKVALFAYSAEDIRAYEADRIAIQEETAVDFTECIASLASAIVGRERG
jgi:uncharacterized membrane protein (UPF0127 family)